MAATSVSSIQIPNHRYGSFLNCPNKKFMSKPSYVPLKRATSSSSSSSSSVVRITASMKNKVYEDRSEGIVCYQDERGEIICEGYDEGPCFQRIPDLTNNHPREAQITNLLLRQSWLQIVKGEKNPNDGAVEEGRVRKDFNCNGFNSLC